VELCTELFYAISLKKEDIRCSSVI